MTGPELAAALGGCLIGVAIGVALMVWHWWQAEQGADAPGPLSLRLAHAIWALRGHYSDKGAVDFLHARLASLTASLDDAHREVSRLTGEKHARDTVIHEAIGVLERLHRQEAGT